ITYASPLRDQSENRVVKTKIIEIGKDFDRFQPDSILKPFTGSWPCFRGVAGNNLVSDGTKLVKTWHENDPSVLWRQSLGEGYAGAIIVNERVYVLDYLEDQEADALRCLAVQDGRELWRRSYHNPLRRNHGKSRTVPAYADNVVVTFGPTAQVMAVNAITGDLLWTLDIIQRYGGEVPQWYAGQCPLIDDGKVILGIGGETVLIAGIDLHTGEILWESPNASGIRMSHASVLSTELLGVDQYIYAGLGGIAACNRKGMLLWECRDWKPAVWAPTPVKVANDLLFMTAGYGAGSALLQVVKHGETFSASIQKQWKPTQGPASEQQTPLVIDDTLFVIQPKDAGALRSQLVAADIDALPTIKASTGKQARFGLGPYIYADHAFWIADDQGVLHVYSYENQTFTYRAHHKILPGVDAWGPIACANGIMILRDSKSMVCLNLKKESQP
ncbi:MAG: PQQ-binding-like beta-propeller repeat protein, partial [Phycisphaeraceae bacterium JB051]